MNRLPIPHRPQSHPTRGFALVVVLIILSMMVVVAVGYLASMSSERTTANAYSNKARAEEAAQASVDSAVALLRESFQAYPDSATVWDGTQSVNSDGTYNEGTTLFLRAGSRSDSSGNTVADPTVNNAPPVQPDTRLTFALPLVSGVPKGQARLVSQKSSILPKCDLTQTTPSKPDSFEQDFTDLNVRRFKGDNQGAIGSPPTWTDSVPKPARAFWVNATSDLKRTPTTTSDDPVTTRYAFWIEDESFRAPLDFAGQNASRDDNTKQYNSSGTPRAMAVTDPSLLGVSSAIPPTTSASPLSTTDSIATAAANLIILTRANYPNSLFPEPNGFEQGFPATDANPPPASPFQYPSYADINADPTLTTPAQKQQRTRMRYLDQLRYLTTTTSSSLNITRHGTQRVNLNGIVAKGGASISDPRQKLQWQVDQTVRTLQYHVPDFGQRFYRATATPNTSALLNSATDVSSANALIYLYKTAANLHDYIDTDSQPTIIASGGMVAPMTQPTNPFGGDSTNPMWAQGKDSVPFLQETVARYRPVVPTGLPPGTSKSYDLTVDYYFEFWNMTDKDIYAGAVPNNKVGVSLNTAFVRVTNQMTWVDAGNNPLQTFASTTAGTPTTGNDDYNIDLVNGVFLDGKAGAQQLNGVVFKAGACTVITTDPDCAQYNYSTLTGSGTVYKSLTKVPNPNTTYYCSILSGDGKREYTGPLPPSAPPNQNTYAIKPVFRDGTQDYETEVMLANAQGYLDCFQYAIAMGGSPITTSTDKYIGTSGSYNDYGYGGTLFGNDISPSELGDPRTNNEQLVYTRFTSPNSPTTTPDSSRYWNGNHTLGYMNGEYTSPDASTNPSVYYQWPDYYSVARYGSPDQASAPAVVADSALTSIGQLGDVFDPARLIPTKGTAGINGSRGGGRTLRIGQHDDRYSIDPTGNSNPNSPNNTIDHIAASASWASWRLADVFSISDEIELPARVNINGVGRDNGAALRTLVTGLTFQPTTVTGQASDPTADPMLHGDKNLGSKNFVSDTANIALNLASPGYTPAKIPATPVNGLQRVVLQMLNRLNPTPPAAGSPPVVPRPFFERGELGELGSGVKYLFGINSQTLTNYDLVATVDANKVFDHSREEFCRRIMEQICTRGDVFTVYAVGQSVAQTPPSPALPNPPKRVTATHRTRVTVRLVPKNADGSLFHPGYAPNSSTASFNDFDPSGSAANNTRFVKPSRFDVEVLYASTF